ncbi:MAG: N-6 DNA methylase [Oscillospiraceae bacterium]|nr:N-6 DNA methylase [Oscillospiraceae bacterium]
MSSILEIGENKTKCQKFTPSALVDTMLNLVNYNTDLMGKTILENSFGSGNILKAIVVRYIESAIAAGVDSLSISAGLAQDIYGIELDKTLYDNCVAELNTILESHNIPAVDWKLFNDNALSIDLNISFDYVIGNPPYISYKEMDEGSRIALKKKFESCAIGKFDYCYAFIESGIKHLNETGKLVQLIPNNIYKNVFAKQLRELLIDHVSTVLDYPDQKLFDKTLTSVSIFLYDKENSSENIHYENVTEGTKMSLCRHSLSDKWMFSVPNNSTQKMLRFGDIFHASITIATLYNKAFIVDDACIREENLEQNILRDAVSPKTLRYKKKKKIIFPYYYDDNGLCRYSEKNFEELFPNTAKYLKQYSKELNARNRDEKATWFEYGRSQALAHLNKKKLLISTIITNAVEVYKVDANTIPFSGIYITVKNPAYSLDDAIDILKSEQFLQYVQNIGINISGKSLRITCKDINNYLFIGGQ